MRLKDIYNTPKTISDKSHVLNFGKYKGWTVEKVMEHDPQYLLYCQSKIDWFDLDHKILDEIDDDLDERFGGNYGIETAFSSDNY